MDSQQFQLQADASLEALFRRLAKASGNGDFDVDLNNGALTIELEESGEKFVVSPNSPVAQIWVSALTRSFKLDWDAARGGFVHAESGRNLEDLVAWALQQRLGPDLEL
jgi:iron donor protein CyaY